jgi:hypothetical protein
LLLLARVARARYAYYAYKLVNPAFEPWWKEHLTKLQMRQFMVNVVGLAAWTYMELVSERNCTGEMWVIYVVLFVMVVFLAMFASFAKKTYIAKPKGAAAVDTEADKKK